VQGYIQLHRKFLTWEWAKEPNMTHCLVWFIFLANWKEKKWQGHTVKRGQFIGGINSLSEQTGLSIQSLRTCIKRLEGSGEIKVKSTNKFTTYTVVKYEKYQLTPKELTNEQQTTNKRTTNEQQQLNKDNKLNKDNIKTKAKKISLQEWEKQNSQIVGNMFTQWLEDKKYKLTHFQNWLDDVFRLSCQANNYKYVDFVAAAQTWYNKDQKENLAKKGEPLNPTDQRTAVMVRAGQAYRAEDGKIYAR